jgi:gluconate 2-dehydrogenase
VSRPRLLITRRVFAEVVDVLRPAYDVTTNDDDALWSPEQMRARAADCDALYVVATDRVDAGLLGACPRLKIVATGSVGFNQIDVAACAARGIAVTNTPDVLTEATADMAWALLMATARRVTESERWLREGRWDRWAWDQFLGADVHGASASSAWAGSARRSRGAPAASRCGCCTPTAARRRTRPSSARSASGSTSCCAAPTTSCWCCRIRCRPTT